MKIRQLTFQLALTINHGSRTRNMLSLTAHLDEGQTTNLPSGSNSQSRRDMSYKRLPLATYVQ